MPFDNPYFPSTFDVGTPGAGHIHFGNDGSMTLYGPDGVTVLASLDPVNGLLISAGGVPGSLVTGTVANATNATNLTGGGSASGQTIIGGSMVVGTPGGANSWAVVGTDANGADGFRLYQTGAVAIDMGISGTPTITGARVQTASSGRRIAIDGTAADTIKFYTGDVAETTYGTVFVGVATSFSSRIPSLELATPIFGLSGGQSQLIMQGKSQDGLVVPSIQFVATRVMKWDGTNLDVPAQLRILNGLTVEASIDTNGSLATNGTITASGPTTDAGIIAVQPVGAGFAPFRTVDAANGNRFMVEIGGQVSIFGYSTRAAGTAGTGTARGAIAANSDGSMQFYTQFAASYLDSAGALHVPEIDLDITGTGHQPLLHMVNNPSGDAPTAAGAGRLYVLGGALKYRGSSGTITTIAPA